MAPNTKKALLVIAAVAALIICFVVLRPSSPPQLTPAQLVQNANLATDKGKTKRKYETTECVKLMSELILKSNVFTEEDTKAGIDQYIFNQKKPFQYC